MAGSSTWLLRQWRRIHPGRNPLARGSDRLEGRVVLTLCGLAVLAAVIAGVLGANRYTRALATSVEQQASRVQTTAVLLADAPTALPTAGAATKELALATWRLADGSERGGMVSTEPGTPAGTVVPIWLDATGNPASAPVTRADALNAGVGVGIGVWILMLAVLGTVFWGLRTMLDRYRMDEWAREWKRLGSNPSRF